jgi:hypothetical protein
MQYPVQAKGFEGRQLILEASGFFSTAKLWIDGQLAPKGPKRGQFLLRRLDGTEAIAKFRTIFLDPVPQLIIDNDIVKVVEPLKWYQWVWAGLPILLIFVGGALGAILGVLATSFNTRIFRSEMSGLVQYLTVAVVSAGFIGVYFVIALIISGMLR